MTSRIWDDVVPERDRAVFAAAGYGQTGGFGQRPALLVVDVTYDFCGDRPESILKSIERFANSCGEVAWEAIGHLQTLLAAARARQLPIVYTHANERPDVTRVGGWVRKHSRVLNPSEISRQIGNDIVAEIAPQPGDIVIKKNKPSGFFGTPLMSYLIALQCDSVLVTGVSTSGCVRATVIDAFSNNLMVAVVEECTFDRLVVSHKINLYDMHGKYADVVSLADTLAYLESLPADLFAPAPRPLVTAST